MWVAKYLANKYGISGKSLCKYHANKFRIKMPYKMTRAKMLTKKNFQ